MLERQLDGPRAIFGDGDDAQRRPGLGEQPHQRAREQWLVFGDETGCRRIRRRIAHAGILTLARVPCGVPGASSNAAASP